MAYFNIKINDNVQDIDEFWNAIFKPNSIELAVKDAFLDFIIKYTTSKKLYNDFSRDEIFNLFKLKFDKPDVKFKCKNENGKIKFLSLEDYDEEEITVINTRNLLSGEKNKYYDN